MNLLWNIRNFVKIITTYEIRSHHVLRRQEWRARAQEVPLRERDENRQDYWTGGRGMRTRNCELLSISLSFFSSSQSDVFTTINEASSSKTPSVVNSIPRFTIAFKFIF